MCTYENINISTCAFVPRTTLIMAQDRFSSIFRNFSFTIGTCSTLCDNSFVISRLRLPHIPNFIALKAALKNILTSQHALSCREASFRVISIRWSFFSSVLWNLRMYFNFFFQFTYFMYKQVFISTQKRNLTFLIFSIHPNKHDQTNIYWK